jgi:hypothetical protein
MTKVEQTVRRGGVGALMGMVAERGTAAGIDVLLVGPLVIQSGRTAAVAPVGADGSDGGHGGSDCTLGGICSAVRTDDAIVGAGVPKLKSMVAPEKGLAGARTAAMSTHAVAVARADTRATTAATVQQKLARAPQLVQLTQRGPTRE